jgi:hypothetical protein
MLSAASRLLFVVAALYASSAYSLEAPEWGSTGHQISAMIAKAFLSPAAVNMCKRLIPDVQGDIAMAASWADVVKKQPAYAWSSNLHFVNTPDWACNYNRQRDCKNNFCLDSAIYNYTKRVQDASIGLKQQGEALKFLVHFIGDVHQPLHVGFASDLGGNTITGQYYSDSGNLHGIWDTNILQQRVNSDYGGSGSAYSRYIVQQIQGQWSSQVNAWRACSAPQNACSGDWAGESVQVACSNSYVDSDGKTKLRSGFKLAAPYYTRNWPVIELQLAKAGVRLANVLNAAASALIIDDSSSSSNNSTR